MLRIRLLGELAVEVDGEPIAVPGRPAQALLAWLALHPGLHARGEVAAALWPGSLDQSARTNLRSALLRLTRALGSAADEIVADRERIGWAATVASDVAEIDHQIADGELERAWDLVQRPMLPGVVEEWALPARDEHERRIDELLERLVARTEAGGDLRAAAAWARHLEERQPYAEDIARREMRLLADAGETAEALAVFERLRLRLAREMAIVPTAATRKMAERLRRRPPLKQPPVPAVITRCAALPFVGRDRELRELRRLVTEAAGGRGRVIALAGHPGIGKTTLAAQLASGLHREGAAVLFSRCDEEPPAPYQPFTEALRQLGTGLHMATPAPAESAADDPSGERFRWFEAVLDALAESVAARPTLLVVDDVHWADRPTLLLLRHLARATPPAPVVLVTYRRAELGVRSDLAELLRDLRRDQLLVRLPVDGLSRDAVGALAGALVGTANGVPVDDTVAATLQRRTAGNPFFVGELLRAHGGPLPAADDAAALAGLVARETIPTGVLDIIGRRVDRLPERARTILELATVLGDPFELAQLEAASELDREALLAAIAEPLRLRVVESVDGDPERLRFHHALVRDVVYARLLPAPRAALHRRAGEALERVGLGTPTELARHFLAAGPGSRDERAATHAERAGREALGALAYEEAARHFVDALRTLSTDAPVDRRLRLLLELGDAHHRAGDVGASRAAYGEAATLAERHARADVLALAALGVAGRPLAGFSQTDAVAIDLLRRALDAQPADEHVIRARLLARLASADRLSDTHAPERLSSAALALARTSGEPAAVVAALEATQFALWIPGGAQRRRDAADELVARSEAHGLQRALADALTWRIIAAFELGDLAAVDRDVARLADLADVLRDAHLRHYVLTNRAARALLGGRLSEAEALAERARGLRDDDEAVQFHGIQLSTIRDEQGRQAEMEPMVGRIAADYPAIPGWSVSHAQCLHAVGRVADARSLLDRLAAERFAGFPRDAGWLASVALAARVAHDLDRPAHAETLHELLLPFADLQVAIGFVAYWGPVAHHLGLTAATAGRIAEAATWFERALASELQLGALPWEARTRAAWGEALLGSGAAGDATTGRRLLAEAGVIAEELGMAGIAARSSAATKAV